MTAPTPRRRSRILGMLAAALLIAAPTVAAVPASAEYDPGWSQADMTGRTGQPGGVSNVVFDPSDYTCKDGALYRRGFGPGGTWGLWYNAPYTGCTGVSTDVTDEQLFAACISHMQVFRFYGNAENPTAGWTTSMVNFPTWCEEDMSASIWTTHALDANGATLTANNMLDAENGRVRDLGHEPTRGGILPQGAWVDPRYGSLWNLPDVPGQQVSGRAFAGNDRCTTVQNTANPFERALASTEVSDEAKGDIREKLYNAWEDAKAMNPGGNLSRLQYARKATGMDLLTGRGRNAEFRFDDTDCGSVMRYVQTSVEKPRMSLREKRDFRVTGACYIPVERYGQVFSRTNGDKVINYPDINKYGGMRYSRFYEGKRGSAAPGMKIGIGDDPATDLEKQILNGWRQRMYTWYMNASGPDINSLRKGVHQVVPMDPFATLPGTKRINHAAVRTQKFNRLAAAMTLRNDSRCDFGSTFNVLEDEAPSTTEERQIDVQRAPVMPELGLVMKNARVLQAGGHRLVQGFTVQDTGLSCPTGNQAQCSADRVRLERLTYTIRIQVPEGMRLDSSSTQSPAQVRVLGVDGPAGRCEVNRERNACDIRVSTSRPRSAVNVKLLHFEPTAKDRPMTISIRDVTAEYSKVVEVTYSYTVTLTDPRTGKKTGTETRWATVEEERDFIHNPSVIGVPAPLRKVPGDDAWVWNAPVIGATSIS